MWTLHFLVITVVLCLLALLTAAGNALLCFYFYSDENRHKQAAYMASIAVADFFMCVTVFPFTILRELDIQLGSGKILCRLWLFLDVTICAVTVYTLAAICMDICFYIKRSFASLHKIAGTKTSALIWGFGLLLGAVSYVAAISSEGKETKEVLLHENSVFKDNIYTAGISFSVVFLLPFIWCVTLFFQLIFRLCTSNTTQALNNRKAWNGEELFRQETLDIQRDVTMLGIKLFVFFFSWCPFFVAKLTFPICGGKCVGSLIQSLVLWLPNVSAWANPFIYGMLNKRVNRRFQQLCSCYSFKKKENLKKNLPLTASNIHIDTNSSQYPPSKNSQARLHARTRASFSPPPEPFPMAEGLSPFKQHFGSVDNEVTLTESWHDGAERNVPLPFIFYPPYGLFHAEAAPLMTQVAYQKLPCMGGAPTVFTLLDHHVKQNQMSKPQSANTASNPRQEEKNRLRKWTKPNISETSLVKTPVFDSKNIRKHDEMLNQGELPLNRTFLLFNSLEDIGSEKDSEVYFSESTETRSMINIPSKLKYRSLSCPSLRTFETKTISTASHCVLLKQLANKHYTNTIPFYHSELKKWKLNKVCSDNLKTADEPHELCSADNVCRMSVHLEAVPPQNRTKNDEVESFQLDSASPKQPPKRQVNKAADILQEENHVCVSSMKLGPLKPEPESFGKERKKNKRIFTLTDVARRVYPSLEQTLQKECTARKSEDVGDADTVHVSSMEMGPLASKPENIEKAQNQARKITIISRMATDTSERTLVPTRRKSLTCYASAFKSLESDDENTCYEQNTESNQNDAHFAQRVNEDVIQNENDTFCPSNSLENNNRQQDNEFKTEKTVHSAEPKKKHPPVKPSRQHKPGNERPESGQTKCSSLIQKQMDSRKEYSLSLTPRKCVSMTEQTRGTNEQRLAVQKSNILKKKPRKRFETKLQNSAPVDSGECLQTMSHFSIFVAEQNTKSLLGEPSEQTKHTEKYSFIPGVCLRHSAEQKQASLRESAQNIDKTEAVLIMKTKQTFGLPQREKCVPDQKQEFSERILNQKSTDVSHTRDEKIPENLQITSDQTRNCFVTQETDKLAEQNEKRASKDHRSEYSKKNTGKHSVSEQVKNVSDNPEINSEFYFHEQKMNNSENVSSNITDQKEDILVLQRKPMTISVQAVKENKALQNTASTSMLEKDRFSSRVVPLNSLDMQTPDTKYVTQGKTSRGKKKTTKQSASVQHCLQTTDERGKSDNLLSQCGKIVEIIVDSLEVLDKYRYEQAGNLSSEDFLINFDSHEGKFKKPSHDRKDKTMTGTVDSLANGSTTENTTANLQPEAFHSHCDRIYQHNYETSALAANSGPVSQLILFFEEISSSDSDVHTTEMNIKSSKLRRQNSKTKSSLHTFHTTVTDSSSNESATQMDSEIRNTWCFKKTEQTKSARTSDTSDQTDHSSTSSTESARKNRVPFKRMKSSEVNDDMFNEDRNREEDLSQVNGSSFFASCRFPQGFEPNNTPYKNCNYCLNTQSMGDDKSSQAAHTTATLGTCKHRHFSLDTQTCGRSVDEIHGNQRHMLTETDLDGDKYRRTVDDSSLEHRENANLPSNKSYVRNESQILHDILCEKNGDNYQTGKLGKTVLPKRSSNSQNSKHSVDEKHESGVAAFLHCHSFESEPSPHPTAFQRFIPQELIASPVNPLYVSNDGSQSSRQMHTNPTYPSLWSPWGLSQTPTRFAEISGDQLVCRSNTKSKNTVTNSAKDSANSLTEETHQAPHEYNYRSSFSHKGQKPEKSNAAACSESLFRSLLTVQERRSISETKYVLEGRKLKNLITQFETTSNTDVNCHIKSIRDETTDAIERNTDVLMQSNVKTTSCRKSWSENRAVKNKHSNGKSVTSNYSRQLDRTKTSRESSLVLREACSTSHLIPRKMDNTSSSDDDISSKKRSRRYSPDKTDFYADSKCDSASLNRKVDKKTRKKSRKSVTGIQHSLHSRKSNGADKTEVSFIASRGPHGSRKSSNSNMPKGYAGLLQTILDTKGTEYSKPQSKDYSSYSSYLDNQEFVDATKDLGSVYTGTTKDGMESSPSPRSSDTACSVSKGDLSFTDLLPSYSLMQLSSNDDDDDNGESNHRNNTGNFWGIQTLQPWQAARKEDTVQKQTGNETIQSWHFVNSKSESVSSTSSFSSVFESHPKGLFASFHRQKQFLFQRTRATSARAMETLPSLPPRPHGGRQQRLNPSEGVDHSNRSW